ncbi:hypothetical protein VP01_1729g4 [Puccinia sorghi]|uniref:Uncharacterized protein n=1 Tax=Puccinia sorghi TaxID=27349 RepID=A0A0L6VFY3_9BASI|nr:hypothetical protein VP01_1729g4 [Puccinia sorghi]
MGISLAEAEIPQGSSSMKIFICTRRIRNFWTFLLYLDTGRLVGELEMNIFILSARSRENEEKRGKIMDLEYTFSKAERSSVCHIHNGIGTHHLSFNCEGNSGVLPIVEWKLRPFKKKGSIFREFGSERDYAFYFSVSERKTIVILECADRENWTLLISLRGLVSSKLRRIINFNLLSNFPIEKPKIIQTNWRKTFSLPAISFLNLKLYCVMEIDHSQVPTTKQSLKFGFIYFILRGFNMQPTHFGSANHRTFLHWSRWVAEQIFSMQMGVADFNSFKHNDFIYLRFNWKKKIKLTKIHCFAIRKKLHSESQVYRNYYFQMFCNLTPKKIKWVRSYLIGPWENSSQDLVKRLPGRS